MRKQRTEPPVARNRRATHDYHLGKRWEAGIVLVGAEVKALRAGRASLVDGFVDIDRGEAWLHQVAITSRAPGYVRGTWARQADRRRRKLLLHRAEIDELERAVRENGMTIVPLSLYFSEGRAKVEIALARGKRDWDKRRALAEREASRDIEREVSRHLRGRRT